MAAAYCATSSSSTAQFVLVDGAYPLVIILCTVAAFFFPIIIRRRERWLRYFDAIGLGVFSALTASAACQTPSINWLSILFLSMFTGCAGGVIRDVLIQKPSLVLQNELYVTPVVVGTTGLLIVRMLGGGELACLLVAMLLTSVLRILAIHYDWRLPRLLGASARSLSEAEASAPAPTCAGPRPALTTIMPESVRYPVAQIDPPELENHRFSPEKTQGALRDVAPLDAHLRNTPG